MAPEDLILPENVMHMIDSAGANPVGLQPGHGRAPALALFTDPSTRTTLALPLSQVTTEGIRSRVEVSRKLFSSAARP